jgi:beta-mannosidase
MRILELGGAWQLRQAGSEEALAGRVPGCVHTDLMAAGKLPDPFWRDNEDAQRWVGEATWEYSRSFNVSEELLAEERLVLRCEGLDTLATVLLNGQEIGRADNMFRTWEFDVKAALKVWDNELVIRFDSPMPYIRQKQAEHPIPSWGGPKEISGRAWDSSMCISSKITRNLARCN